MKAERMNIRRNLAALAGAAGMLAVLGAFVPAQAAEEGFSDAQKKELETIIRDYLVGNPDVVVDALDAYQRNREEMEKRKFEENFSALREQLLSPDTPSAGNAKADVTIVEFFDYNCGYCKKAVSDIVTILAEDNNVRVLFKEMPILSASSHEAARWALAAGKQGKYYDYHVALMSFPGAKDAATYEKIGKDLKLDVDRLRKDANEDKGIRESIEKNLKLAQDLSIRGTPAFIIGDRLVPGYMGIESLKQAVSDVRQGKN